MTDIIAKLKTILDGAGILQGEDVTNRAIHVWRDEPITALAILRPTTTEQVSQILKVCNDAKQPLVAHGGRTGLVKSGDAEQHEIILSLERMHGIEEVDTVGRTMRVKAGTPLQAIQEAAEKEGLLFPLDLGARGTCQIGGNVSTNAGGNRVIRYGMARDNILGLEAVLGDGTVVSSLNEMIKNNAGYDLKQLFIGSEGTLGIITRLVLRLREATTEQDVGFVGFNTFEQVTGFLKHMDRSLGGTLSAFEVMWHDYFDLVTTAPATNQPPVEKKYAYYALVESLGAVDGKASFEAAMESALEKELICDAAIAQSGNDRASMWAIRDSVEHFFRYGPAQLFDVSIAIRHIGSYVDRVKALLEENFETHHCFTLGHIGDGNVHFAISVPDACAQTHELVERCVYDPLKPHGGSVSAEHGIGLEKKKYLDTSRSDTEIALMRKLKQTLDPNGILNPGKIFEFHGATIPAQNS
ncbi:MAG: FAD-binding oxidoreductase [Gammaproteobacteria bacterium]